MIKKAVLSYFNPEESFGNKCGFVRYSDFLFTTALSTLCASRHFPEVQFVSSTWGVDLIKSLDMPFTSYSNKLNEIKTISKYFWAYGKLLAYNEQTEPFVHIDNDVFLWQPLPDRILKAPLCFQSKEPFKKVGYQYYDLLKKCWAKTPVRPQIIVDNEVDDFAYNCGICGGNDLNIFKEWIECSKSYIFAPENQKIFFKKFRNLLIHQNLFHEQYFIASLIKSHGIGEKVRVLASDVKNINKGCDYTKPRITHLWGTTKMDQALMYKVRITLIEQDLPLFVRINKFCKDNDI